MLKRAEGEGFSSDDPAAATIAERLDAAPFCRLRLAILCVVTLALFADIAEVALGNALGAVFQAPPRSMTRTELSIFLAAIFAGGAAGAPFFGLLGDRTGRRLALQLALLVIAAGSLGAAVSDSPVTLIGFRDPPPLNWSTLKYVFWQTGGSRCRRSAISPKRSSRSYARSMCWSRRGNPLPTRSARSA